MVLEWRVRAFWSVAEIPRTLREALTSKDQEKQDTREQFLVPWVETMAGVLAVVDDLFFVGKLQETARQVGAPLTVVRAADFSIETLRSQPPALVIFDLNTTSASAVELIRQLKADSELRQVPVLGFFSHVQVELQRAAQAAGCEQVLPRSKFTAQLPDLLRQSAKAAAP